MVEQAIPPVKVDKTKLEAHENQVSLLVYMLNVTGTSCSFLPTK